MGCCGGDDKPVPPVGAQQPGDVLAMALWHGNRSEYGRYTGRHYPRISMPRTAWVDPRDVEKSPELWQRIEHLKPAAPVEVEAPLTLREMADASMMLVKQAQVPPSPALKTEVHPNVTRVIQLARRVDNGSLEPIFVYPEVHYPSYTDFQRLVSLSGFDAIPINKLDIFSRRPYIIVSPEPIPNTEGWPARIICWQLEYAGDYTHNYDGFKGEMWASDKAWAEAHGAKYVLMGSHAGLVGDVLRSKKMDYDVTMLGYMTPRRQAIKDKLSDLRWPVDYPGHGSTQARADVLFRTRLMLNIHQHDNAPYLAPQRIAVAAAYGMPVLSETTPGAGDLADYLAFSDYADIAGKVRTHEASGDKLHQFLCVERPFRDCVMEALRQPR